MLEKIFAILGGLLCVCAAYYDWNWFFDNMRAKPFVKWFGRDGARTFYTILGIILIVLGLLI
ncbi:MAG: immunity 17 family protein [Ruminococcus sp.]|nr:immunity 17 family protein [Ruminococcus sp.]